MTNIVAAYVRHNQIGADQLPIVISTVHQALAGLGKSKAKTEMERTPAVPIRRSVHQDPALAPSPPTRRLGAGYSDFLISQRFGSFALTSFSFNDIGIMK